MKNLKFTLKAWPVVAAVTIGLCALTQWGAKAVFGIDLPEQDQLQVIRAEAGLTLRFAGLLAMVLVASPVVEELLFRLVLFKLPAKALSVWGTRAAWGVAAVASAVFSAAHYPDWLTVRQTGRMAWLPLSNAFLALGFFGLAQCWLYRRANSLVSPIVNHFLFNLTNLALMFIISE